MNAPHDPSDPLLSSLTEECADLPARAALEARRNTSQRRKNRRQLTQGAIIAIVALTAWKALPPRGSDSVPVDTTDPVARANGLATNPPADAARLLPTGLSEDQQRFMESSPDLPMLLVRNSAGKVTRIHFIER